MSDPVARLEKLYAEWRNDSPIEYEPGLHGEELMAAIPALLRVAKAAREYYEGRQPVDPDLARQTPSAKALKELMDALDALKEDA